MEGKFILVESKYKLKMALRKLYDPSNGKMQVAGLISGIGTNLQKIIEMELELQKKYSDQYHVAVIFTNNSDSNKCNAIKLGKQYNIPVVIHDIKSFYGHKGGSKSDLKIREEYDAGIVKILKGFNISLVAYAGYNSICTESLIKSFTGVAIHPGDLSIINDDGTRKYVGIHAVRDAIFAGEKYISASTHIVEKKLNYGKILMISEPMELVLERTIDSTNVDSVKTAAKFNQAKLKEVGDWKIFPQTIINIAQGRYAIDECGQLQYNGKLCPNGLRLF